MSKSNVPAVRRPEPAVEVVRSMLDKSKGQIAAALPRTMSADRMIRMAMSCVQRNPALLACDPRSIVGGVIQACELGLELSGPLGQAYLIPYKTTAQFQVGYRGLIQLAYRSGLVTRFRAFTVYEGDEWQVYYGTKAGIRHVPALKANAKPIAFYAVLRLKFSDEDDFEVMSVEQVQEHRRRYSKSKPGPDNPWDKDFDEMGKKTVLKRLGKRAPLSAEIQFAMTVDDAPDYDAPQPLPPLVVADADPGEAVYQDQRPQGGEHDGRHEPAAEGGAPGGGEMFPAAGDANEGPYGEGR